MDRKTVRMRTHRIERLPDNRPVVYKIRDSEGENIYTGSAGKGNVQSRIKDHLPGRKDAIPGAAKVQIEQALDYPGGAEKGGQHHRALQTQVQ